MRGRFRLGLAIGLLTLGVVAVSGIIVPHWRSFRGLPGRLWEETVRAEGPFDRAPLVRDLAAAGFSLGDRAFVRIFKREHRLELWMKDKDRFRLFRHYAICTYSGELGPKFREGDKQSPEGFYRVGAKQLNPHSRHHLAFNLGFPNALDRQLGRTGSFLMVHGGCTSVGCYAMTDEKVDEIYAVMEAALGAGQREVDVHIFPFRPTEAALREAENDPAAPFWANLKQGFDLFEASAVPPEIAACGGQYRFGADATGAGCTPIRGWV